MVNTSNTKDILKDLQAGFSEAVLADELQRYGKVILEAEVENLLGGAPPSDYAYLSATAQNALNSRNKGADMELNFEKIGDVQVRQRLQYAVTVLGTAAFCAVLDKLYAQKVAELLARELPEIMRNTPVKELNRWVSTSHGVRGEISCDINYGAIKAPRTQKLVQALAQQYGENKVGREIERVRDTLIRDRIALWVETQDAALDPLKAFTLAQATLAKSAAANCAGSAEKA